MAGRRQQRRDGLRCQRSSRSRLCHLHQGRCALRLKIPWKGAMRSGQGLGTNAATAGMRRAQKVAVSRPCRRKSPALQRPSGAATPRNANRRFARSGRCRRPCADAVARGDEAVLGKHFVGLDRMAGDVALFQFEPRDRLHERDQRGRVGNARPRVHHAHLDRPEPRLRTHAPPQDGGLRQRPGTNLRSTASTHSL